jgi:hypothetical protein
METELEKLEAEALKLTPGERAALAQRLLASLEEDAEIEEAFSARPWTASRYASEHPASPGVQGQNQSIGRWRHRMATMITFHVPSDKDLLAAFGEVALRHEVNVRSMSRVGRSDLGMNAKRIRTFMISIAFQPAGTVSPRACPPFTRRYWRAESRA